MNPHGAKNVSRLQMITSPHRALNQAKTFTHAATKITTLRAGHPLQSVSAHVHPCDAARTETPNATRTVASRHDGVRPNRIASHLELSPSL